MENIILQFCQSPVCPCLEHCLQFCLCNLRKVHQSEEKQQEHQRCQMASVAEETSYTRTHLLVKQQLSLGVIEVFSMEWRVISAQVILLMFSWLIAETQLVVLRIDIQRFSSIQLMIMCWILSFSLTLLYRSCVIHLFFRRTVIALSGPICHNTSRPQAKS